jgi:hypothetical protein
MRRRMRNPGLRALALLILSLGQGCQSSYWRARFAAPAERERLDLEAPFVKVHTHEGHVYVLTSWNADSAAEVLSGAGLHYDVDRRVVGDGQFQIPFNQIALAETNRPETLTHASFIVLGVLTGLSAALTVACLTMPKACFGSCPTFYADGDTGLHSARAEGFSRAVARVLEETDIDALGTAPPDARTYRLTMKNEALETHVVRRIRLGAVPRPPGGRVLRAGAHYYPTTAMTPPRSCGSERGDCLDLVSNADDLEYLSPADERDLSQHERIELSFARPEGRAGLVIRGRTSLLSTFLYYQMLAYMGAQSGEWMRKLERGGKQAIDEARRIGDLIGAIDVEVLTVRGWSAVGTFEEHGPIARDTQLLLIPGELPPGDAKVRLWLAKGAWKLDQVAVVELGEPVQPIWLEPAEVLRKGAPDVNAARRLRGEGAHLITYPGDVYAMRFELPPGEHELFLEARGYYYEWVRKSWLHEESADEVVRFLFEPTGTLRRLASVYKRIEPRMEEVFWQSRVASP